MFEFGYALALRKRHVVINQSTVEMLKKAISQLLH